MVQFGLSGLDRHDVVHDGKYLFIKCINMKLGLFRSKFDAVTIFWLPFIQKKQNKAPNFNSSPRIAMKMC